MARALSTALQWAGLIWADLRPSNSRNVAARVKFRALANKARGF